MPVAIPMWYAEELDLSSKITFDSGSLNVMWHNAKLRLVLASSVSAAVACWPVFFVAASELLKAYGLVRLEDWGDDLFIGVNLLSWLYPIAFVCSFIFGQGLVWMGLTKMRSFLATSSVIAFLFTLLSFATQVLALHFSLIEGVIIFLSYSHFLCLVLFLLHFVGGTSRLGHITSA